MRIFEIKTVQSGNIRTLFEVLKEVLNDINIIITPEHFKISEMDSKKMALVHLTLEASKFEQYYFTGTKQVLSINTTEFFRLIKNAKNEDTLCFFMDDDEPYKLGVSMENTTTNKKTTYKMNLMDIPPRFFNIEGLEYDCEISIPSALFNDMCKQMNQLHVQNIEIISVDSQIIFKGQGAKSDICVEIGQSDASGTKINRTNETDNIIQGIFPIEYLVLFAKAQNLCRTVSFYFTNGLPLLLLYSVGSLGTLKYLVNQS